LLCTHFEWVDQWAGETQWTPLSQLQFGLSYIDSLEGKNNIHTYTNLCWQNDNKIQFISLLKPEELVKK